MLKRIGLLLALVAALAITTTAFAQAPGDFPTPAGSTRINFEPGTTAYTFSTALDQGVSQRYVFGVAASQVLYVIKSGNASVQVFDPQGSPLSAAIIQPGPWGVAIHQTGDHSLELLGQGIVSLTLYVPPLGASAHPPVPLPFYSPRIRFAAGTTGTDFPVNLAQGEPASYLLGISAQQELTVLAHGNLTVSLLDDHGDAIAPSVASSEQWLFAIPRTGDYTLVLLGSGPVFVSLAIPPLNSPMPPAQGAERIMFAPGTDSTTITARLWTSIPQSYILGISRGQTLYISTSPAAKFQVIDPLGNEVVGTVTSTAWVYNILQDGDYTVSFFGTGPTKITFWIPPLPGWF